MVTISLCMIVKNEEFVLGRCLECVKDIADEIVIVDTGSFDETKEVARRYNSKIYDFEWIDDFSAARNFSFSKAACEYILWLDADDIILDSDREKFLELKQSMTQEADMVIMKYNVGSDDQMSPNLYLYRERLLKRCSNHRWNGVIHECIPISGKTLFSDVCITHKKVRSSSDRNLKVLEKAIQQGIEKLDERNVFYLGKELFQAGRYEEGIKYYKKLIESGNSHHPFCMEACLDTSRYYMHQNKKDHILKILISAFLQDIPRAEICCYIAAFYRNEEDYQKAIAWYETVFALEQPNPYTDYVMQDYWGYIPCIELCYCYFKVGDISEAMRYNELAAEYKPNDTNVEKNREFFSRLLEEVTQE